MWEAKAHGIRQLSLKPVVPGDVKKKSAKRFILIEGVLVPISI
jgi:hypothetical protein